MSMALSRQRFTVTVAVSVPPLPSSIVYVNESIPAKPAEGVYEIVVPLTMEAAPFAGVDILVIVRVSPTSGAAESFDKTSK